MATISMKNIRYELCHVLRNANVLSTSVRGVTTTSENFLASVGQTTKVLSGTPLRNIRTLSIDASTKTYLRDFTVDWGTATITFNSALVGGESVSITYDYGNTDKIFPDMPRDDLTLTSYPRIGIELVSLDTEPFQLGGGAWITDGIVQISVWMPTNKDSAVAGGLGGTDDLSTTLASIRSAIQTNQKAFVTIPFITPSGLGPITVSAGKNAKVLQQSEDHTIKFLVE